MKNRSLGLLMTLLFILLVVPSRRANAQDKYATQVSAGALFPSGTYGQYFSTGYGVNLGFSYADSRTVSYHLQLGYGRLGLNNDALNESDEFNIDQGTYDVDGSIILYPIIVGVKFYPDKQGPKPYGLLEFGLFMATRKFDGGTYTSPTGSQSVFSSSSQFRMEPGLNLGIGVLLPVSPDKSLDLGVRYSFVKDSQYYSFSGSGSSTTYVGFSQYFSLNVGLEFSY